MHKIKLILLLILPLSVLGQDLGIIDTKTTKNPAINGTHRISTDGKNLFFRNFFGLSKKVASTDSAVFTGTTVLPSNTTIGNVSATELGYLDGVTSPIQAQINSIGGNKVFYGTVDITNAVSLTANVGDLYINTTSKAVYKKTNLSFPTGLTYIALASGTWVKLGNFSLTKSDVGLSDVDNTSDANKPISSATQTALNGKENTLTKGNITSTDLTITGGTSSIIGTGVTISLSSLGRIRHFSGAGDVTNAISLTANIGDIYFNTTNGTVYQKSNLSFPSGLTYITLASGTWVKLGDYTLDKSKVGLSNVDNTSDANKPISSATQTALNLKQNQLNGTGFVKATGTTISYDNSTYLSTSSASSTYLPIANPTSTGTLTAPTIANSLGANFATTSGNVGIGTSAPNAKLEINGSAYVNSEGNGFIVDAANLSRTGFVKYNAGNAAIAHGNSVPLVFGQTNNISVLSGIFTEQMRISTNSNVLIGTPTDAGYKLDVNGTVRAGSTTSQSGALISARNTGNSFEFGHPNQAGYGSVLGANSGNGFSFLAFNAEAGTTNNTFRTRGLNGRVIINDINNNRLQFQRTTSFSADNQTPVVDMTIDGSGNMGIGTVAPSEKLEISGGNVKIANNQKLHFGDGANANGFSIGADATNAVLVSQNNNSSLRFNVGFSASSNNVTSFTRGAGTESMRIDGSGNVGIGTTAPNASSILDITSTTKGVLFPRMTTAEISAIASPADGLTVYNTTLKAICFYDSSAAVWKKVSHSNM